MRPFGSTISQVHYLYRSMVVTPSNVCTHPALTQVISSSLKDFFFSYEITEIELISFEREIAYSHQISWLEG